MLMESHGFRTLEAETGPEALQIWNSSPTAIDLLFVDIVLPGGISGPALAARLKAENPKLHVIYTTGYHPASVNEDLTLLEGINFLQKPYDTRTLARMVRNFLNRN
jgi:CheY-like chemotaxis protein